jgi:hypothetical protein
MKAGRLAGPLSCLSLSPRCHEYYQSASSCLEVESVLDVCYEHLSIIELRRYHPAPNRLDQGVVYGSMCIHYID